MEDKYFKVIDLVNTIAKEHNLQWCVISGFSLYLHGINLPVRDIDINTTKENAPIFAKHLKDFLEMKAINEPTDTYYSDYYMFAINDIHLDICGEFKYKNAKSTQWENKNEALEHPELIKANGLVIPVSPLIVELKAYEIIRQEKDLIKSKLIRSHLHLGTELTS
jgi:hypothetical protein